MRELGSICLRCRSRLLIAARAQGRRGISRYSTAAVGGDHDAPAHNEGSVTRSTSAPRWALQNEPPAEGTSIPRHVPRPHRAASLAMFQSIVESQATASPTDGASGPSTASIELVKDVAKIQTMLDREGATLAAAYSFFETVVYPKVGTAGTGIPQIIKNRIGALLLDRLALEKPHDFESANLPSVSRITELMIELDVLKPSVWATLVIELIQHISQQNTSPDAYTSIESYENAMARRGAQLRDLVGAWKAFCRQRASTGRASGANFPSENELGFDRTDSDPRDTPMLPKAFGAMFPHYLGSTLLRPAFAAYATYRLLTDRLNCPRTIKEEAASFLDMMKTLIFRSYPPGVDDFAPVFEAFPYMRRFMQPNRPGDDSSNPFLEAVSIPGGKPKRVDIIHRQLGQAIKARNVREVNKVWRDFWGDATVPDTARIRELAESREMFDYFILAYMMMRQPQQAIQVWNNIERIGVKATIKTWNSMLRGCAKAHNADGIQTVWRKLVVSGTKLDTVAWTTRIHGLIVSGDPAAGLRALGEMAKVWAAREDPRYAAIAVQPTAEPVNAALAGLLRLERDGDARKVLAWAAKQGIDPDIYTFNTLLRPLIRRGDMAGIKEIFDTMREANVQVDVATATVLLEGSLMGIGGLAPHQQVALVKRILAENKEMGFDINMQMYAKMVYLLLREGDGAGEAVKAVLAHIWRRGLELTSHIYTMLAEHYFSRDPPDAAAVTALIESRRLHENRAIDRVFWERVIKGYSRAGETARALAVFDRVFVEDTTITLSTLHELLRALVEDGEREAARRVVELAGKIAKAVEAAAAAGPGSDQHGDGNKRIWRHRLWHLAFEQGLMGEQLADRFTEATAQPSFWGHEF